MKIQKSSGTGEVIMTHDNESIALSRADWNELRREMTDPSMQYPCLPEWGEDR